MRRRRGRGEEERGRGRGRELSEGAAREGHADQVPPVPPEGSAPLRVKAQLARAGSRGRARALAVGSRGLCAAAAALLQGAPVSPPSI
eukprot:3913416-Rhodomonas_salina.1